jgi:biopolymer transport protein ExbD
LDLDGGERRRPTIDKIRGPGRENRAPGRVPMMLLIIFMMFGPGPSKGLRIDWKERRYFGRRESLAETMSIYIAHPGQFYVNENAAKRQELEFKLRAELGRRAVWTV